MGPPRSRCAARRIGERGNSTSGSSTRRFRHWRRASGRGRDCAERRPQLEEQAGEAPKERLVVLAQGVEPLNLGTKRVPRLSLTAKMTAKSTDDHGLRRTAAES